MLRLFLLLFFLVESAVVLAQEGFPTYAGHVNDFAGVVDVSTKERLERLLRNFEERTAAQIALVTVKTLNDRPIEEYANQLYRAWGIGAKTGAEKDKGALLLVALQDRKTRLEVGYGLEGDLPDGLAGEIIRRMRPFLQQQDYSQGLYVGARTLVDTLAHKWNVSLAGIEDRSYAYSPRPSGNHLSVLWWVVLLVVLLIVFGNRNRGGGRRAGGPGSYWWAYPIIFNRGGGTFGGGGWNSSGWGGGGSGGGWGGFGGGSSGGGGASDSW